MPGKDKRLDLNLTEFLGRQSRGALITIGLMLLAAVVLVDQTSGPHFEFAVFYLIPVSFFGWFLGRRSGLLLSLVCAAIACAIHWAHLSNASSSFAYWNALAWLAVYVFFILIISELGSLYGRERAWSRTDALTGIPNRRAFFERLEIEKNRARRHIRPLTLAYVDLDHFKEVNDMFGHAAGDKLLGVVATAMKLEVRQTDAIARLGGDEFAVLLPETDKFAAAAALGKLRSALDAAMQERNWPVTFSIGVVTFQPPPESVQEIVSAADQAMYTAKKRGRGQLIIYPVA